MVPVEDDAWGKMVAIDSVLIEKHCIAKDLRW